MAPFPFVGRSAELETLRSLIPRAEADAGRVALLVGETGSGKSRLVRELSAQAAADGVLVLYGSCVAVLRTPYVPFVEAVSKPSPVTDALEVWAALRTPW